MAARGPAAPAAVRLPGRGWLGEGSDEFVWLLEHDDRSGYEEADEAFYASTERCSFDPDPARLIVEARHDWVARI